MNIPSGLGSIPLAPVVFCLTTLHGHVNLRCILAAKLPFNLDRSGQLTLGSTGALCAMDPWSWRGTYCPLAGCLDFLGPRTAEITVRGQHQVMCLSLGSGWSLVPFLFLKWMGPKA
jgi:hypothetical protein